MKTYDEAVDSAMSMAKELNCLVFINKDKSSYVVSKMRERSCCAMVTKLGVV